MVITLTTDFGDGSPYVGALKGVILRENAAATLVDLSHNISPQDVRQAAILLAEATPWFPAGSIHLAVVDPGVGTDRAILYTECCDQRYLVPDNGLLSLIASRQPPSKMIRVEEAEFWLPDVSATFHGRDIFAPVAARLSLGLDPERLGPRMPFMVELEWPQPSLESNRISGQVLTVDTFGNLITSIPGALIEHHARGQLAVECEGHTVQDYVRTYGSRTAGTAVALIGSCGCLELSVVNGSAALRFSAKVGSRVYVSWIGA